MGAKGREGEGGREREEGGRGRERGGGKVLFSSHEGSLRFSITLSLTHTQNFFHISPSTLSPLLLLSISSSYRDAYPSRDSCQYQSYIFFTHPLHSHHIHPEVFRRGSRAWVWEEIEYEIVRKGGEERGRRDREVERVGEREE